MTIQGTPNEIAEFIKAMRVGNVSKKESNMVGSVSTNNDELMEILDEINNKMNPPYDWSHITVRC